MNDFENPLHYKPTFLNNDLFVIAEIGGNHEGDFDYANRLIDLAFESGAQAIKFQIYRNDKIVNKIENPDRFHHFSKFQLTAEQYKQLAQKVTKLGRQFMASLWDPESVEQFDPLITIHKV